MITELEFKNLVAQGYNRIALVEQALADLDTPLSLYLKLAAVQNGGVNSFLLESVMGGERFGRYSFIGLPAQTLIKTNGFANEAQTQIITDGQVVESHSGNPLDVIATYQSRFKVSMVPGMPRFCGGLAGYFGYDAVRYIEPKLAKTCPPDTLQCPDILLLQCEELAVVDNFSGKLYFIIFANPQLPDAFACARRRMAELHERLRHPVSIPLPYKAKATQVQREFEKDNYIKAVKQTQQLIAQGDVMQVQVGQRLAKPFKANPLSLYRALRSLNPSPYLYYYHFDDHHVVGSSPEILVRQEWTQDQQRKVTIRPLAGTRPRGATAQEDLLMQQELEQDPKERAEHVMLIDLARNDIGRIAQIGTVEVTESFKVERYSHVMHLVSNVQGLLRPGVGNMDVFKATFPAGTLSGAPKVRAMEIIDQFEPSKRGLYGGACGYLSYTGDMDLAIAIRTGIIKDDMLYVQAAAGVVADSIPEKEWLETENKAKALLQAVDMVEKGFC